jgi:nucleotide-binding universal stress UspA family protein
MYSKILVPLDGSTTAEKVLPCARYLAARLNIPVELLAVVDVGEIAGHMGAEKARFFDTMMEEGVRHLTEYLRGIATSFVGDNVHCSVEKGKPEDVIIERAATDKNLLVTMASHGRSGLNRFLLGSVAEKVLRGTVNPLLLIRATEQAKTVGEATFKSVVVPLDGSELAESVLPAVVELAKRLDLEVELFRAYHIPYNVYAEDWGYVEGAEQLLAGVSEEATTYLEKKCAELKARGISRVTCATKEGFARDEIIKLGRSTADNLIAMCSHGRSGVKRWVLGSVAEAVARHSGDPVLIFRAS